MRPTAVLLAGLVTGATAAPRLHVSTTSLTPESTIELVLDRAAADSDRIGKEAKTAWLDIQPAWTGTLFWKEANVLEFRPAGPPALGTTYTFKLTGKHAHLDGSVIPVGELTKLSSEPFQVDYAALLDRYVEDWSPRTAAFFLRFNGDVTPDKAAPFLFYEAEGGKRVAAKTERATFGRLKQPGYMGVSWTERFANRGKAATPRTDLKADTELPNGLIVTPLQPLPAGENWRLSMLAGLPDASGKVKFGADATRHIGTIEQLKVASLNARVVADEPRRIVVDLNAKMPVDLPPSLVKVEPQPKDLRMEVRRDQIHLIGDFSGENTWKVTLDPALTSQDGRALGQQVTRQLTFTPLKPELALPSQDESQLASGNRKYRVQTVNLASVKVRVKRLTGAELIRAQQGYRHYTGMGHDGKAIKPTHVIPYEMLGGETIADLEIPFDTALDTTQPLVLDWDKVLAGDAKPYTLGFPKDPEPVTPEAKAPAAFFVEILGTPKDGIRLAREDRTDSDGDSATAKSPVVQALVQLTDIGLAWKIIDGEARVFAFSCLTGKPLPDVELATYGEDAKGLQQVKTGADGMAVMPREKAARHLEAKLGNDRYSVAYDSTLPTIGLWRFPVRYSWEQTPLEMRRVFLFTDRSLYRPGETVHLKGIVRHQDGNDIKADAVKPAQLVVTDPKNKEILRRDISVSPAGGFDASFELPGETTGYHQVTFEYPDELAKLEEVENWSERSRIQQNATFSLGIRVEEFRRNAFEVTQKIDKPEIGAKTVTLDLKAAYYQGQPVAKGEVETFTTVEETNFYPEKFRDYLFGDHRTQDFSYWYHYFGYRWDDDNGSRRSESESSKGQLTEGGEMRVALKLPDPEFPMAREVSVSSEVTDANRQTLNERTQAVVHPASVYVGISRLDRLVRAGDRIPLGIVAVKPDGEAFDGEVKFSAKLSREVNDQVRLANEEGGTAVRNESRREELSTTELVLSGGKGTEFLLAPQQPGLHQIELRGTDAAGNAFATVTSIHVYGGDEYPWAYEEGVRIKLVPEKKVYLPGETARVLVLSPIEGSALVTVEREKVLRSFMIDLKADKPVIDIPLGDDDAPNAYVSVLVIKGAQDSGRQFKEPQLRLGYCELTVENRRDKLGVTLNVPKDSVLPGQEVELVGSVLLADGKPAANAEVTLYAEDEGTLAVMGYETPDPMAHFYDPRSLRVDCGTTLGHFVAESPEEQSFYNKGFFIGGGDGEYGSMPPALRRDFNPCAGWQPALTTDASGKFTATFKMPDTLTRYRVIAVAHHGTSRFGHTKADLVVNKPLMVEPQAPRFANEGDSLDIRALVQNASEYNGTWKITFTPNPPASDPVAVLAGAETEKTLTLAAGGSATVIFPVDFKNTGEAVFTWKAEPVSLDGAELTPVLATRLADRVESRFQVQYPVPLLRQMNLVKLDNKDANLLKGLDPALLGGRGNLELELSRSRLSEAAGSVDYLLQYPYGCVEQTTSSMMPWLAVEQLRGVVPSFAKYSPQEVKKALQKGVNRLLTMQTSDGGFGYWPGDREAVPWASAYAGLGLILAKEAGAEVPEAAIASLAGHLESGLRGIGATNSPYELENACRATWILAMVERQPAAYINALKNRMADLTPRSRCLLALAAEASGTGDPRAILRDKTKFRLKDDGWMSIQNDHALSLLAWSAVDSESAEATTALDRMIQERNPYGHWQTTWVNGWSLLALATYAENHDESTPATVTLTSADGPQTITLEPGKPAVSFSFPLDGKLALSATSDQTAYVRVKLASKPAIAPQKPVAKNGMEITRFYERVKSDGTTEPLEAAKLGDLVKVTLQVALPTNDSRYLVVEDHLPSIFEAVNNDFASQAANPNAGRTSENDWAISHSELRSDRAVFFYDRIWRAGRTEITYLARCTMEGKAVAPPAKVESMYDPNNTALSASREF
ncbi:MG2 domain-containing protein [Luteolibacter flavescens]|uniref:MG2 domain-containing protein n=1 Tax=Luteolibacter flavescens TaxID=1859460 RepID=A0ABT3FMF6_9BACT|nr:MG2 domain-containing protein [Luteolibacter flavescens]MCW1884155.1 MG2 domain-containing protein [Luteolibacter flavescens]